MNNGGLGTRYELGTISRHIIQGVRKNSIDTFFYIYTNYKYLKYASSNYLKASNYYFTIILQKNRTSIVIFVLVFVVKTLFWGRVLEGAEAGRRRVLEEALEV